MPPAAVWPGPDERRLLARFYLALGLSRALYLIYPFEFAYLYLVMDRPEWAVVPLVVMSGTSLVTQFPTGLVADRWSRKSTVLLGGALSAGTYLVVPWAARLSGSAQLVGVSAAFALVGLGQTFMSGAQEAWVVDNLKLGGRDDLVDTFFARTYTVQALGGVIAGGTALVVLVTAHVDQGLLDALWYATGVGFLVAVAVALTIPETRGTRGAASAGPPIAAQTRAALGVLVRSRTLLLLTVAILVATMSGAAADEAFPVSLLTKGMDARGLAPLAIVDDLVGMAAPAVGLVLARRVGAERVLARSLVVAAAAVLPLLVLRDLALVCVLFVTLGFIDRMWDPVAFARLQRDIPSEHRAALNSVVYEAVVLAELLGLGLFGLLLGSRSSELSAVNPDLVDAFSGRSQPVVDVPTGLLGLPLPDFAIVVFIGAGLLAVPFVVLARRRSRVDGALPSGGRLASAATGRSRRRPSTRGAR